MTLEKITATRRFCITLAATGMCFVATAQAETKGSRSADGLTPRTFVSNCESMNGAVEAGNTGPESIKCTLPSGTSADCTFGPKDAYCETSQPRSTKSDLKALGGLLRMSAN